MSALGQKQTFRNVRAMSAIPPKADIRQRNCDVRFGPNADIAKSAFSCFRIFVGIDWLMFLSAPRDHWPETKTKRRPQANFINRMTVGDRMANSKVERQIVADLPN